MKSIENWKICVLQICTQKGTKYSTKQSLRLEEIGGNHSELQKILNHIPSFGVKGKVFGRENPIFNLFENEREAS